MLSTVLNQNSRENLFILFLSTNFYNFFFYNYQIWHTNCIKRNYDWWYRIKKFVELSTEWDETLLNRYQCRGNIGFVCSSCWIRWVDKFSSSQLTFECDSSRGIDFEKMFTFWWTELNVSVNKQKKSIFMWYCEIFFTESWFIYELIWLEEKCIWLILLNKTLRLVDKMRNRFRVNWSEVNDERLFDGQLRKWLKMRLEIAEEIKGAP